MSVTLDAVALKLPAIWTEDVEGWFSLIESQFELRKITCELTRFHYVVASLDSGVSSRVKSILRTPPADPYSALKKALIAKYSPSPFERAAAIRDIQSLGGQKPSEVMDRMLSLLGAHEPDLLFNHHFISILPDYVRNVLASSSETDPEKLAEVADKIFIAGKPSSLVSHVNEDDDRTDVCAVNQDQRGQGSSTGRSKKLTRGKPPQSTGRLCFYHARFGARANKCDSSYCTWQGNLPAGRQ